MIKELLGMASLIAALLFVSGLDQEDAIQEDARYCEMVAIWLSDAELGIPPENRNGWPPYNDRMACG